MATKRPLEEGSGGPETKKARVDVAAAPRNMVFARSTCDDDTSLNDVFLFDLASTPDEDKITTLLCQLIGDYDERVNVLLFLFSKGVHPCDIKEDTFDSLPAVYSKLVEDDEDDIATFLEWTQSECSGITNLGKWKVFTHDEDVDEPCEHYMRFFTQF